MDGAAGVGQYYRHAVHQAVLYRAFIRTAEPLHSWFDAHQLNARDCRAAVVMPEAKGFQSLIDLANIFDVDVLTVSKEQTKYGWVPPSC